MNGYIVTSLVFNTRLLQKYNTREGFAYKHFRMNIPKQLSSRCLLWLCSILCAVMLLVAISYALLPLETVCTTLVNPYPWLELSYTVTICLLMLARMGHEIALTNCLFEERKKALLIVAYSNISDIKVCINVRINQESQIKATQTIVLFIILLWCPESHIRMCRHVPGQSLFAFIV